MARLLPLLAVAIATCALATPAVAAGPVGSLTELSCITADGMSNGEVGQCVKGRGLAGAQSVVLSPDESAYTYTYTDGAIAMFPVGRGQSDNFRAACVAPTSISGGCYDGRLGAKYSDGGHSIAISPDGSFLFSAGKNASIVGAYQRDGATGMLIEVAVAGSGGCVSSNGADADGNPTCTGFIPLEKPQSLAVSPDGRFLYAGGDSPNTGVTIYSVGPTGELTPLADPDGCVTPAPAPKCNHARYARTFYDIALSADGRTLYGVDSTDDVVVAFARDAGTGKLTQIAGPGGCVYNGGPGPGDPCTPGHGLSHVNSVEVSPDGKLVTVGTYRSIPPGTPTGNDGIVVLHRDAVTGELSQPDGSAGCVNQGATDGCGTSRTTGHVYRTLFSPDGRTLFVAAHADGTPEKSGISVFDVAAAGALTQRAGALGCYSDSGIDSTGAAGGCTPALGVRGPVGLALSANGARLYEAAYEDNGIAAFRVELAPTCTDTVASVPSGSVGVDPLVLCTDANGDPVTLAGVDGPAHGSATFSGPHLWYAPAAGFSGDDRFRVKASDGVNDSAPATVTVHVRVTAPEKLSVSAKPKRDRKLPYKFTFSGNLRLPPGVFEAQGCTGKVALTVKRGKKIVLNKSAKVSSSCKWKVIATFKNRKKLGKKRSGTLTAAAKFGGNAVLLAKSAKAVKVRYG
ncbi:MAG: hypothetical protein QOH62_2736 [Solirubrobacteraceae bacterium]|nr:hypothetical protein [Solirubrobacteraceae bacterium]